MLYCHFPFESMFVDYGGQAHFCGWMTAPALGNILQDGISGVWNGKVAQEIRESFYDGSLRFCRKDYCPHIMNGNLKKRDKAEVAKELRKVPERYELVYDYQCNLTCPSCRDTKIVAGKKHDAFFERMEKALLPALYTARMVSLTGHGDPFFSPHSMHLLQQLRFKNESAALRFETNGHYVTPDRWETLAHLWKNHISMCVSVDSLVPSTYTVLRRGGRLERLLENMEFMLEQRKKERINRLVAVIVVQDTNYLELSDTTETLLAKGFDSVNLEPIHNWGTFSNKQYFLKNLLNPVHPYHEKLLQILEPYVDHPQVTVWSGRTKRHANHIAVIGDSNVAIAEVSPMEIVDAKAPFDVVKAVIKRNGHVFITDEGQYLAMLLHSDLLPFFGDPEMACKSAREIATAVNASWQALVTQEESPAVLLRRIKEVAASGGGQTVFPIVTDGALSAKALCSI